MKHSDLVALIASETNNSKANVERILRKAVDTIGHNANVGESTTIAGLGKFKTTMRAARTMRNPSNGGTVKVPTKRAIKLQVSETLKRNIQ